MSFAYRLFSQFIDPFALDAWVFFSNDSRDLAHAAASVSALDFRLNSSLLNHLCHKPGNTLLLYSFTVIRPQAALWSLLSAIALFLT